MSMRVVIVMPPATHLTPDAALDRWPTVVQQAAALREHAGLDVMVACRAHTASGATQRHGVPYRFALDDRQLVRDVCAWRPDVVHVHGLGFTRLTIQLGRALRHVASIVLQHHGEPPGRRRTVLGHRIARRYVDGYLFTGASTGQAQPFVECGMIDRLSSCHEVLEAACTLPTCSPVVKLAGRPALLWVGRLIESKDPLSAIAAFAIAGVTLPEAHLHLLATDRSLELIVRAAIASLGPLGERVHLHDPVPLDAMRGWYAASDIYVSTSRREGSGYSLIEALTEGCSPVATSIPSHSAIIGNLAPIFQPGDAMTAAQLIVAGGARTGIDRDHIRAYAARELSWSAVADQLVAAYGSSRESAGLLLRT